MKILFAIVAGGTVVVSIHFHFYEGIGYAVVPFLASLDGIINNF